VCERHNIDTGEPLQRKGFDRDSTHNDACLRNGFARFGPLSFFPSYSFQDACARNPSLAGRNDEEIGMSRFVIYLVVFALALPASGWAAPVIWSTASGGNGHAYELVTERLPWPEAKAAAEASVPPIGFGTGHLVTISGPDEDEFIVSELYTGRWIWIGFTDEVVEGEWRWIDDTPGIWQDPDNFAAPIQTAWTNWVGGEPNNSSAGGQEENHLLIWLSGTWNDGTGPRPEQYVVE
jgi:hypothetical protein